MSNLEVTVDTTAVEELLAALRTRVDVPSLQAFLITRAHRELRQRAEDRFANEGDDVSGPWAELAYATSRIRAFQGYGAFTPINVRTGKLRSFVLNSFTVKTQARGVTLMMPGPATGELLSKFQTAQQGGSGHAVGSEGPNRPAPPRPVLGLSDIDERAIVHDLYDWIRQGIF